MKAKKSLGQNFLISPYAVKDMVNSANIKKGDIVLEIGPGKGVLTEKLLNAGAEVISIEKDKELIPLLEEKFKKEIAENKLTLIEGDILKQDLTFINKEYKLVANIPYYITGAIIKKFLEEERQPSKMVLLLQKEVAERIIAKDGKESILSISVKVFGHPIYVRTVSAGSFVPRPKVDSAILVIDNISKDHFKEIDKEKFFEILHLGFSHKRKQLLPNLAKEFSRENLDLIFSKLNLNPKCRAEDLSFIDWLQLSKFMVAN